MSAPKIEAIYPLSPMQQGMLFHSLVAPTSGVYVEQVVCGLKGDLDRRAFERAWQHAVDTHPVLRSAFVWEGVPEPVQVVQARIPVRFEAIDWRALSAADQGGRLEAYLQADRRRGYTLAEAPLMRLTLIRTGGEFHHFVWSHHHLLLDGWSAPIIVKDVFSAYEAIRQGLAPEARPAAPYRDYIAWLRRRERAGPEAFWRRALAGFTEPTPLVVDRRDGDAPAGEKVYGEEASVLDEAGTEAIQSFARRQRLTLNTLALGAWALLLRRYSGRDDVVFGTTVSGRSADLPGVESMVGLFINTLPLRVKASSEDRLLPWLRGIQEKLVEMRDFEHAPLVDVQGWSDVPSGTPLFESLVVFENYPMDAGLLRRAADLEVVYVRSVERTNYPLTVTFFPGLTMRIEISYQRDRFEAPAVRRMLGHLGALLAGMAADPEGRLDDVPALTAAERAEILETWNDTREDFGGAPLLHEMVEAQAERTPDRIAVSRGPDALTYRDLDRRANQLAHHLRALGVGPESVVAVCMRRTPAMLVALLGVLKAGGAWAPLDAEAPGERLAYMLADARVSVVVTESVHAERFRGVEQVVRVDSSWREIARHGTDRPPRALTAENLAYIIYTSGSTGAPKGVMVTHRGICNRLRWGQKAFPLGEADRMLQKSSLSFDVSVWECLAPLVAGARVVLAHQDTHQDAAAIARAIAEERITVMDFVPSLLRVFLDEPSVDACRSLRVVTCGGEALSSDVRDRFAARLRASLVNMYGPTEVSVDATCRAIERGEEGPAVPIGRPISNTRVYVLDDGMRPVPVGVPGEIFIGGAGLARGYLSRPDLTAERFVPDPFGSEPGGRLYRSGDRARFLDGGEVEFLGRLDHQVKVRGFRIELGEIESVLAEHPAVRHAAVTAREDVPGHKRLVAYVTARDGGPVSVADLRRYLGQRLPDYMAPAAFVEMESLPMTPAGKVDRKALPAPGAARPDLETPYTAPGNPAESTLARIWAEVLHLPVVGVHDDFFELGGDSILSIQVVARAREAGVRITPRQMFQHPTVAALAAAAGSAPEVVAEQGLVRGDAPLTPIQRWFFEREILDAHHWNQAVLLRCGRRLDAERLRVAVQHVMMHHDALRLRFTRGTEGWRASHAGADALVGFRRVDLSGSSFEARGRAIEAAAQEEQAGLSLSEGPLMRLALFDAGEGESGRLLVVAHHLVMDAVSWSVVLEDLLAAYEQLERGSAVELALKTTSWKQWAERLVAHAGSAATAAEMEYWTSQAWRDAPRLPRDFASEGAGTEGSAVTVTVSLDEQDTRALLAEVPPVYRTEINDVLLAGLGRALAGWSGTHRLLVEMEGHGREPLFEDVDVGRTVGWFTTTYPLLLEIPAAGGPGEALKAVKEQLRRVPGKGIGWGLLRYLDATGGASTVLEATPRPEVSFNYLGRIDQVLPGGAIFAWAEEPPGACRSARAARSHLIEINGSVSSDRLAIEWTYSETVHRRSTIERLAERFVAELRAIIDHCRTPGAGGVTPSDFPEAGLSQAQLDTLIASLGEAGKP